MDFDIGVNLFCSQFPDPYKIYEEAKRENVSLILTGSSVEENRQVHDFVKKYDCYGTAGVHPHNANQMNEEVAQEIISLLQEEKIVAIGECGLDYNRMFVDKDIQLSCLRRHLEIARKIHKPLFLHCREAEEDFLKVFEDYPELCHRSVVHCFTGGVDEAKAFLEKGFYFGITGWLCDPKRGEALREAVKIIPLDRLMVETDSPYLTPKNRKKLSYNNVPQNIFYILEDLAALKGISVGELRNICRKNTLNFFCLTNSERGE